MENTKGHKQIITKTRPEPDFQYLARRAEQISLTGNPLDKNLDTDPGEIPGFYAEDHTP